MVGTWLGVGHRALSGMRMGTATGTGVKAGGGSGWQNSREKWLKRLLELR
jgi:hypothetical protein